MSSTKNHFSLTGKNALLICPENPWGKDIALGLVQAGAKVYLAGNDKKIMAETVRELGLSGYGVYDHQTKAQTLAMVQQAQKALGSIDVLVENSLYTAQSSWNQSYEQIHEQLKKTHLGMMLTVQAVGNVMAQQRSGSVILMTETAALAGYDVQNYTQAPQCFDRDFSLVKGFIYGGAVNYARQAAGYLGTFGGRCNCIACAPCTQDAAYSHAYLRHSHIKTPVIGTDVADAVVFLAGDGASHITGVTLPIDGGYTAK